jgi:DNA-binding CsgD family transcriptional regulator
MRTHRGRYPSYSDIITAIYHAAIEQEHWAETLGLIADYLRADSGMVLHLSASRGSNFIIHQRLSEDLNELFLRRYTQNPYGVAFARAPIGRALVTEALVEKKVLHRSAFYADILAPQGIAEIIAVRHSRLSLGGFGGILFNFSKRRAAAVEHAATRLEPLISHLSPALDLTLQTSRLNTGQRQLDHLLASMAGAVILLDRQGAILKMTASAEALLGEQDGLLIIKRGHLTLSAQSRDDSARLATSIKQALTVAHGEPQKLDATLQIQRPSGRRCLLAQVMPLPVPAVSPWAAIDDGARVMVQIVDPQSSIDVQAERLRRLVGLTAAETRVAALLASGLGLTETASALGVSLNTVKTHSRQVFAKAGVRSSAALVRFVTSIPAGPPQVDN